MSLGTSCIAISGDLGSGKSSISAALAAQLDLRRVSTGDLHRAIAASMGVSTLELNRYAEKDAAVDDQVDGMLKEMARAGAPAVVDSRLAWHFIEKSVKLHLLVDPGLGARRIMSSRRGPVEGYASLAEAEQDISERARREQQRFLLSYGIDIFRLRNYDVVYDTTRVSVEEASASLIGLLSDPESSGRPQLYLDPKRIYPTRHADMTGHDPGDVTGDHSTMEPLSVGYSYPYYFVLDGHRRLSAAIRHGWHIVPAVLAAEGGERLTGDLSADQFLATAIRRSDISAWAGAHGIHLSLPPVLDRPE